MENKRLTNEEQINVVKQAIEMLKKHDYGLCCIFHNILNDNYGKAIIEYSDIKKYIPLFTRTRAVLHAKSPLFSSDAYWWKKYDSDRMLFLEWMIKQLDNKINRIGDGTK